MACPHCKNGWFDDQRFGTDVECVNGVLIDVDEYHDGWQTDLITAPLRALHEAATPGTLVACGWGDGSTQNGMTNIFNEDAEVLLMECIPEHDAALIVAAVNSLPHLIAQAERANALEAALEDAWKAVINSPETADFMAGVPIEAAHQRERWGADHDEGKSPYDWFWLIGYLSQKAASAAVAGDAEKAMHHTISTAAALANWHAALSGKSSTMHPGISIDALEQTGADHG